MASPVDYYYLYGLNNNKHLLLRTTRPGCSNARQQQEDYAYELVEQKKAALLHYYLATDKQLKAEFIGVFAGLPLGDILYEKQGKLGLENLYWGATKWSEPWIVIGQAANEAEFLAWLEEEDFADNGWKLADLAIPPIYTLSTTDFITEQMVDLSHIPNADSLNL